MQKLEFSNTCARIGKVGGVMGFTARRYYERGAKDPDIRIGLGLYQHDGIGSGCDHGVQPCEREATPKEDGEHPWEWAFCGNEPRICGCSLH